MKSKRKEARFSGSGAKGAALCILVGLAFLILPIGNGLTRLSYDLPFFFRSSIKVDEAVILYMDEASEERLGQGPWEKWDRSIHARLLNSLTHAKVVVFDILFSLPGASRGDKELADAAAKAVGKVVVAARPVAIARGEGLIGQELQLPFPALQAVTAWGPAEGADEDMAIREHYRDLVGKSQTMAWRAAALAGAKALPDPLAERWVNYYGPPGWITSLSYADVALQTNVTPGLNLSNKLVFIGGKRGVGYTGGRNTDDYRTPYTRWTGSRSPGVEVVATSTTLNLMRNDWLKRLPPLLECLVMALAGATLGLGLVNSRPMTAAVWGVLAALLVSVASIVLVWQTRVWFPWMIVLATQAPCALGWSLLVNTKRLLREKTTLEQRLALAGAARGAGMLPAGVVDPEKTVSPAVEAVHKDGQAGSPAAGASQAGPTVAVTNPAVPDHEMLFRIGQGAYGEVWLARDILGTFHAVKIVYRTNFPEAAPYDREFHGLKRFTPISRAHPGLVNILHVGRNPVPEYFYYVMEAGDDEVSGPNINPRNYSPRNLAKDLNTRKRLPLVECLQLGADLAAAVEFLHQQHLIHRDIKPSNIIFVKGEPKLADVGLVTDMPTVGGNVSYVGTRGYLPPEGPGTALADVYSLGKVLYEAAFGMACSAFPELPGTLLDQIAGPDLLELNQIILKACEDNPAKRFQSAADLQAALAGLLQRVR